jgi:2-polyprenyl-6-methoxyphenol hydroxylase-like FAD-dependent oxidoreductase
VCHSLRAADVPDAALHELADESDRSPPLWSDTIRASLERRTFVGTPITEYVPDRLVNGRLALVGNAAHVPTPMTGSGVSSSIADADALANAVASDDDSVEALRTYEHRRLSGARGMVQSGQHFSRSFAAHAA